MASSVLDLEQGLARELGKWNLTKNEDHCDIGAVEITLEDEDEINFMFGNVWLIVPADRIRRLLKETK